jgi:hypothetical protein
LYWDNTDPNNLWNALSYTNWWVNENQTITARGRDTWWSRLRSITLQQSRNGGWYTNFWIWNNLTWGNNTLVTRTQTRNVSSQNGSTFRYRVITEDYAGNTRTITNSNILRIDTVDPSNTSAVYTSWGNPYTPWTWSNQDVLVQIPCSDALSGCDMYNQWWFTYSGNTYRRTFWNTTGSSWTITLRDNAAGSPRNTRSISYGTVRVDKTTPANTNITVVPIDDHVHDQWNDDRSINLSASLSTSGQVSPRVNYYCMDTVPFWSACDPYNGWAWSTSEPNTSNLWDGEYHWRAVSCTSAGNCSAVDTFVIKIDNITPTAWDIQSPSSSQFLANHYYPIDLEISRNSGSPIVEVRGRFENWNSNNWLLSSIDSDVTGTLSNTVSMATWQTHQNICNVSNVSANQNDSNCNVTNGGWSSLSPHGWRDYRFEINYIRDEAGNVFSSPTTRNYEVYANTTSVNSTLDSSDIFSWNIADSNSKDVVITLRDDYGNAIIDASWVSRQVGIDMNIENYIRTDQFINTSTVSAVSIDSSSIPIGTLSYINGSTPGVQEDLMGEYNLPFYIYAPSNYASTPGYWSIGYLGYNITWTELFTGDTGSWAISWWTNIDINIDPIYTTRFNQKLDGTSTFIEWVQQTSTIRIENAWSNDGTSRELYLEFGWAEASNLELTWNIIFPWSGIISEPGQGLGSIFLDNSDFPASWNNTSYFPLNTNLSSSSFPMADISSAWLASVIEYSIWGTTIRYPSDMINKTVYHTWSTTWSAAQVAVKIIWNTSSSVTQAISLSWSTTEFDRDVRLLWEITKSSFRKNIQQKVYWVIRNIPAKTSTNYSVSSLDLLWSTWSNSNFDVDDLGSRWHAIHWDTILYFWNMWGATVTVNGASNIEGNKTIVVENGNVYLNGDIENPDGDWTLAIIVLTDDFSSSNVWDILIDDGVTDLHTILYTNKSIFSSTTWSDRLDWNVSSWVLENQLYIKWSLFSENTIWWSRISPDPICPYYVSTSICSTRQQAQAFDLNYLRRYFTYDGGSGYDVNTDSIPWFDKNKSWAISNAGLNNYELAEYPVIIDYNPLIQQTPPPFFD